MIEYVLEDAKRRFQEGQAALERRDAAGVLGAYHGALESLLRWSLVRDGADPKDAFDPQAVLWHDLLMYLDVRAVPPAYRALVADMHELHAAALGGQQVDLPPRKAVEFAGVVEQIFRKLWPRTEEERQRATQRGEFGRRAPAEAVVTAEPNPRETRMNLAAVDEIEVSQVDETLATPGGALPPAPAAHDGGPAAQAREQQEMPADEDASRPPNAAQEVQSQAGDRHGVEARSALERPRRPDGGREQRLRGVEAYGAQAPGAGEPAAHVGLSPGEERQRRVLEAGRRLRELRAQGYEYCPKCRSTVRTTAPACAHCDFDLQSYRQRLAGAPAPANRRPTLLDRIFGRRQL